MTIGIYKITHLASGKVYIGQSRDIEKRWRDYRKLNCKGQAKIYNTLKKYGVEAFSFEVLATCPEYALDAQEAWCIWFYNSVNEGYNCMHKARGPGACSKETKAKLSAIFKGFKHTDEAKEKIRLSLIGNKYATGKKHGPLSEERKAKIGIANKGRPSHRKGGKISEEHRANIIKAKRKLPS